MFLTSYSFLCFQEALKSCLIVNAPLLYRAACQVPFSVLKYAMTLDGEDTAFTIYSSDFISFEVLSLFTLVFHG